MQKYKYFFLLALLLAVTACSKPRRVYFGNLKNNQRLKSPFKVVMKAENLIVEPATNGVRDGYGHHHIIIDSPFPPLDIAIPKDEKNLHFGNGETETILNLPVGKHKLLLLFAKGDHIPYVGSAYYQEVTIEVTEQMESEEE